MKFTKILSKTLFLSVLSLTLLFVSCKDDDKEPENVDTNPIVGSWQYSSATPETANANIPALQLISAISCINDLKLTFESNNNVVAANCQLAVDLMSAYVPITSGSTWKVENNTLTLKNGTTSRTFPIIQNGNDLTIVVATDPQDATKNVLLKLKKV